MIKRIVYFSLSVALFIGVAFANEILPEVQDPLQTVSSEECTEDAEDSVSVCEGLDMYEGLDLEALQETLGDIENIQDEISMTDAARLFYMYLSLQTSKAREKFGTQVQEWKTYILYLAAKAQEQAANTRDHVYAHDGEYLLGASMVVALTLALICYTKPACIFGNNTP